MNIESLPSTGYVRQSRIIGSTKTKPPIRGVVQISHSTLWRWVKEGKFPKPTKLSERVTAWRVEEVVDWIERQDAATGKVVH